MAKWTDNRGKPLPDGHPLKGTNIIIGGPSGFNPKGRFEAKTPNPAEPETPQARRRRLMIDECGNPTGVLGDEPPPLSTAETKPVSGHANKAGNPMTESRRPATPLAKNGSAAFLTCGILIAGAVGFAAGWFGRPLPNITTWTDPEMGCDYLVFPQAVTPRMGPRGRQICNKPATPPATYYYDAAGNPVDGAAAADVDAAAATAAMDAPLAAR